MLLLFPIHSSNAKINILENNDCESELLKTSHWTRLMNLKIKAPTADLIIIHIMHLLMHQNLLEKRGEIWILDKMKEVWIFFLCSLAT